MYQRCSVVPTEMTGKSYWQLTQSCTKSWINLTLRVCEGNITGYVLRKFVERNESNHIKGAVFQILHSID